MELEKFSYFYEVYMESTYKYIINRNDVCSNSFLNNLFFRSWMVRALSCFESSVNNNEFPCLFGKKVIKLKKFFLFFSSISRPMDDLVSAFNEYTDFVKRVPVRERIYSPFVVFLEKNTFSTLKDEHQYGWSILQMLHDKDKSSWPLDVPKDTENEKWSFCFNGLPLFVNISCPQHKLMKSRNLGDYVVLVINPRENFDEVASLSSKGGRSVRETIRNRIKMYNDGVVPSTLGVYGEKGNYEWRQYQLEEPGGLELKECPLHIRKS